MVDTPRNEMNELEETLKALENKDEKFESFYADLLSEFGDEQETVKEAPSAAPVEEEIPGEFVFKQTPVGYVANKEPYQDQKKAAPKQKKDRSIPVLTTIIILELLGIAGVAAYWFLKLM